MRVRKYANNSVWDSRAQTTQVGFGDLSLIGSPRELKGGPEVSFPWKTFRSLWLGLAALLALRFQLYPISWEAPVIWRWPLSGICMPWGCKNDTSWVLRGVFLTRLFFTQTTYIWRHRKQSNIHIFSIQGLGTVSRGHVFALCSFTKNMNPPRPWKVVFLFSCFIYLSTYLPIYLSFFQSGGVSWCDVTVRCLSRFSWGGVGKDSGSHLFMIENWPRLLAPCCVFFSASREFCPTSLPSPILAALTQFGSSSW